MSSLPIEDKSLRIGIVLNQFPVPSETFIQSFLGHLKQHKVVLFAQINYQEYHKVSAFIKPYINALPKIGHISSFLLVLINIFIYKKRFIRLLKKGISIKQLIVDANIWTTSSLDVLHFPFANNAFGREHYAEVLGAKMTLSFRGSDINIYPIYHKKSYAQLWPYVHKVQCNSVELAVKLKEHKIPDHIPIEIIPPALRADLQEFEPSVMNSERLGTPENPLYIVTLGRLHWVKDYPFAMRAIRLLKQKGITFKYNILGEGVEREQLMFLIHDLELTEQVELHGRADSTDINQYFRNAHVYLQTSQAEGFSNACLEAQAFGLPCIVPNISGMNECIEHGKTGLIVHNRLEAAFCEAILACIEPSNKFNKDYISLRIKEKFDLSKQKQKWLLYFETLN
jgi:colanic acid/amylovoran biosynthesis glycosyltransferase